jgi:hypothetical protein
MHEKKRYKRLRAYHLSPSSTLSSRHTDLAKCDSKLERVMHRISEFYLAKNPRMIVDQRI